MFRDRHDAGIQLARQLKHLELQHPLVLAIPRGGVVIGDFLARELGGELDVVLARKLRAPEYPELAIGAMAEDGAVYLNHQAVRELGVTPDYLAQETQNQREEIARRQQLIRKVRPAAASLSERSRTIDSSPNRKTALAPNRPTMPPMLRHQSCRGVIAPPPGSPRRKASRARESPS